MRLPLSSAIPNPTFSVQQPPCDPGSTVYKEIGPGDASQDTYEEPVSLAQCNASLRDTSTDSNVYDVPKNIEPNAVELDGNAYVAETGSRDNFSAAENAAELTEKQVGGAESLDVRMSRLDKSSDINDPIVRQRGASKRNS